MEQVISTFHIFRFLSQSPDILTEPNLTVKRGGESLELWYEHRLNIIDSDFYRLEKKFRFGNVAISSACSIA